jgi:hypothetical protein
MLDLGARLEILRKLVVVGWSSLPINSLRDKPGERNTVISLEILHSVVIFFPCVNESLSSLFSSLEILGDGTKGSI